MNVRQVTAGMALALTLGFTAARSEALPKPGARGAAARIHDANDRALEVGRTPGRPTLLVYEDKESSPLNGELKAELSRLARGERYRSAVTLVPVADVREYDYWPVRGFVRDAIRDESRKVGTPIYCDWNGAFGRAFGIQHGTSTVILLGKDNTVLFAYEGKLPKSATEHLLGLLRAELDGAS
jgi:hypothetical protein